MLNSEGSRIGVGGKINSQAYIGFQGFNGFALSCGFQHLLAKH